MSWSISEVARISGVTSRTLRHYDEIGLLAPAHVGANGHRVYGPAELRRLQRILLLRELGVGLAAIRGVLDEAENELDALRRHHQHLLAERRRLVRLAATVAKTIDALERGRDVSAEEMFDGLSERQAKFESELVGSFGEGVQEHLADNKRRTKSWVKADYERAAQTYDDLDERMGALVDGGAAADDTRVVELLDEHYAAVSTFWTPSSASYAALGQLYVEHPEFRIRYDARHPALAEFYRDAMTAYAATNLT